LVREVGEFEFDIPGCKWDPSHQQNFRHCSTRVHATISSLLST